MWIQKTLGVTDTTKEIWLLSQQTYGENRHTSAHPFIHQIAKHSRGDRKKPDEKFVWRECYSFSERENRAFALVKSEAKNIAEKAWEKIKIETDPIWNLYIRVEGSYQKNWKDFETHMVWSHLDSVWNGGKYDGVAGVAAGIDILREVLDYKKQRKLFHSFCLTILRSEESSPHNGIACLGSAIATGNISREVLESITYKIENGKAVSLKDHLESSLRRYFQEKKQLQERHKRPVEKKEGQSHKYRTIWGEGEEYVDHEWWYWFCKFHNFSQEDYSQWVWWEKICDALEKPIISKEHTTSYHELRIEQGTLIENTKVEGKQAQLWIVSWGIGGVKRYKTLQLIPVDTTEVSPQDYDVYSFRVWGIADHTGSTPNNPELESSMYRRDANIATNLFLKAFLDEDFWELIASTAQNDEWYTKVPYQQKIELAIKKSKKEQFEYFLKNYKRWLNSSNRVDFWEWNYESVRTEKKCILKKSAQNIILSLLGVSHQASIAFQKQKNAWEKQFGTTRATLTNVYFSPDWLHFQLDIREIHTDDVKELIAWISSELQSILPQWIDSLKKVSEKTHAKIDDRLRDTLKEVSDILWYVSIFLPSIPWHDADRIAAVWVPTWMVFVRQQDGISHNPSEKMRREDYHVARSTLMESVLANLARGI